MQNETEKRTIVNDAIAFGKILYYLKEFLVPVLHLEPRGFHPGEQTLPATNSTPYGESSLLTNAVTK
jgi:hypothetical protein